MSVYRIIGIIPYEPGFMPVCWLVGLSVGLSYNFLNGRKVTLPSSSRSTIFLCSLLVIANWSPRLRGWKGEGGECESSLHYYVNICLFWWMTQKCLKEWIGSKELLARPQPSCTHPGYNAHKHPQTHTHNIYIYICVCVYIYAQMLKYSPTNKNTQKITTA